MVTYLRQDPTTNLMSPVSGVQVQPATQGQPVEISASGRIDASLLPTTYDPKIDVVAAEAVQAGDLCYLLWENSTRVIRKAVSTAWTTLSTVFVKESYAQGAAAAAYIHGVMTLVNPGTFTAADVGTSIYLSPTIPGYFQKNYPTATGQFTQRVAVITDVTETTLSCFFIGYLDRGRTAGSGLVDTDPTVSAHLTDHNNPHQVNATQVGAVATTQVGVASGVAPLGANSLVPDAYLPTSTWKSKSVRVVMTSNVNLASPGATLDGLTMTAGDRALLTAQTDLGAPGVYVWNSATTAMTRATDADTAAELCESIWVVAEGTQAHSVWMNTNKTIPTLGSTLLTFVRILDPGWTNPLTTSGDLLIAATGGSASRLAAGANGLVLTMVAGLPKWSELSVSGMTNPMTDQGDIVYGGVNGVPKRLATGVAAQVLTVSNGGVPYWAAPTTGFANPMQDGGDLILGGSGGAATRLAVGSNGQVLTIVGATVQWAAGGLTNPMTTHGDLLWGTDGGVPRRLGMGVNGQVLTVVSGGLQWAAPTTGFANPMNSLGDLILGGTNGEGARLAMGTVGQVLTATVNGPRWSGASGLTNPMTAAGDLIVGGTSGAAGRMGIGVNGQVLTVVSGAPTWTAPATGFVNPMTASGDLIIGGTSGAAGRMGVGTNGQVMTVVSGAPTWATPSTGMTNPMTSAGDLIYGSTGGAGARLAAGTENQVLSMKSGLPTWVTGGGSYSDPMTTLGDMLVRGASATERLAKGVNGQILTMVSGVPAWSNSGAALTNPMTAAGDIIIGGASGVPVRLGRGTDGQVLKTVSGGLVWAAESGGGTGGSSVPPIRGQITNWSEGYNIRGDYTPKAVGNTVVITGRGHYTGSTGPGTSSWIELRRYRSGAEGNELLTSIQPPVGDGPFEISYTYTAPGGLETFYCGVSGVAFSGDACLLIQEYTHEAGVTSSIPDVGGALGLAPGDLVYGGVNGVAEGLAVGANGQVLTVGGSGLPVWTDNTGTGHGEVLQYVDGASVGTPITSYIARLTPRAVGNRIHLTTNEGSIQLNAMGRTHISLCVNDYPVGQFSVSGKPGDVVKFPGFDFVMHVNELTEMTVTLISSGFAPAAQFSEGIALRVEELDDSQMPLNIGTISRIEFSEPDANQDSYYPGDILPYHNPWVGEVGSQWLASVPMLPDAEYKWEVLGAQGIQVDHLDTVAFTARVGTSISLKCTRTTSDGRVEVAESKVPVYYRAMKIDSINPDAKRVGSGSVADGLMSSPEVGFMGVTEAMVGDGSGGIIFGDYGAIRRISADRGTLSLIAGAGSTNGQTGYAEGTGSAALLDGNIYSIIRDISGNDLIFSEPNNHRIRKVDSVTGVTRNYIGTGSRVDVFPASSPLGEAAVNCAWAMSVVPGGFFFIDEDNNGRILRYVCGSTEVPLVGTFFDPKVNFSDYGTMMDVVARTNGEGDLEVYVAFDDAIVKLTDPNKGSLVAGHARSLGYVGDFYRFGAMQDYVSTYGTALFYHIQKMYWVGSDNGYLVVNDAGAIRRVSPSATPANQVTKTLCIALANQSWSTSKAFMFTPNTDDETLPTILMGGINAPLWVESPGLVMGPYVGEEGFLQTINKSKSYDVSQCFAIDETCPRYLINSDSRGRSQTMGWTTRKGEMWQVDFYAPKRGTDGYFGRVEQEDGTVYSNRVSYSYPDNFEHISVPQTHPIRQDGAFLPVVVGVNRSGDWPAPAFIYGIQVGSSKEATGDVVPWVPPVSCSFDALGRVTRVYAGDYPDKTVHTLSYYGLDSTLSRITIRSGAGLERIAIERSGCRITGLDPTSSNSSSALDDYDPDSSGNPE